MSVPERLRSGCEPAQAAEGDSLAGQFVVATPELEDHNFSRTVVLMTGHDDTGAVGLVINRVVARGPLARLVEDMGVEPDQNGGSEVRVYAGGPVGREFGFVLHSRDYRSEQTVAIDEHVALTPSLDALEDIAAGKGPRESLVAFGYASWAAGQLENEIAAGAWAHRAGRPGAAVR